MLTAMVNAYQWVVPRSMPKAGAMMHPALLNVYVCRTALC